MSGFLHSELFNAQNSDFIAKIRHKSEEFHWLRRLLSLITIQTHKKKVEKDRFAILSHQQSDFFKWLMYFHAVTKKERKFQPVKVAAERWDLKDLNFIAF